MVFLVTAFFATGFFIVNFLTIFLAAGFFTEVIFFGFFLVAITVRLFDCNGVIIRFLDELINLFFYFFISHNAVL